MRTQTAELKSIVNTRNENKFNEAIGVLREKQTDAGVERVKSKVQWEAELIAWTFGRTEHQA